MAQYLEVHVTAGSREQAEEIARAAVEGRAAACAQISGPIASFYWWEGRVEDGVEHRIVLKTTDAQLDELVALVKAAHSYDVPQIVAVPIVGGLGDYLRWIEAETSTPAR
ncbi:divalent-cation tolerance protein CutA [Actinomadura atramentaria]|uniref:divalent-cation tolerance protein CutA n=1 Tax=Actinomadura atramentaria TaxID=1990 RepID=UPI00047648FA|nr:divalent-cation tolerance protein CutA [Actinomadura atramentaria]